MRGKWGMGDWHFGDFLKFNRQRLGEISHKVQGTNLIPLPNTIHILLFLL